MKIGIYDVDSLIPNLAIMKISAYHKMKGDSIHWYLSLDTYDKLYISKLFDFSTIPQYPNIDGAIVGGTGIDYEIDLPPEINSQKPDYSIYPDNEHDIGFISRGCQRRCEFCCVPQKEGKLKLVSNIWEIYTGIYKKMMLLDNNFTGLPGRIDLLKEIIDFQKKTKVKITFKQGLDIRTFRDDFSYYLNKIKYDGHIMIAWDLMRFEKHIMNGLSIALKHIKPYKFMCYVLVGFDTTEEEDLYRIEKLRELKVDPFVMPYKKDDPYQNKLARWANHKAIYKTIPWHKYKSNWKSYDQYYGFNIIDWYDKKLEKKADKV